MRSRVLAACWFLLAAPLPTLASDNAPNLAVSNINQSSAQVRWEPISDATRYELSHGTDPAGTNRGRLFVSGTAFTLNNLMPNTVYRTKVRAVVGGRAGAWSPVQEFSTPIPVMEGLIADDIRDTTVHLVWSGMFADLPDTSYEVSYGTDLDAASDGVASTTKNFITLRNLMPETTYYIKLRARNPQILGPWSLPLSITTLAYSPAGAPQNLSLRSGEGTQVILTWQSVSEAAGYDIAYGTDPAAENMGIVPVVSQQFQFQLAPNTRYYFKVRAVVKGNSSPWSEIVTQLTLPAAPRGVSATLQTSTAANISWKSLSGGNIARFYHVSWGTDAAATNMGTTVTANSEHPLEGLKPDQTYYVRIRTANASGVSPWSEITSFRTLTTGPGQLKVQDVRHTSAKITWPEIPRATGYEVVFGLAEEAKTFPPQEVQLPVAELKGLKPAQTYYLKVRALLSGRQMGPWSNVVNFTTFPVPDTPRAPGVDELAGTYARLTWTALAGISTYELLVSTDEFSDKGQPQVQNRSDAVVKGLSENTTYYVKLRAVNLGGPGTWSEATRFTTLPALSPRGLSVSNVSPTEALLTWEAIPGSARARYEIRYAAGKDPWRVVTDYPAQTLNLEKLASESTVRVQVRAKNESGLGPWCSEIAFTTPPLPPDQAPAGLRADEVTDISAKISWKPMERVSGYRLSLGTDTDAGNRSQEEMNQTDFSFKGLMPETNYFVKIKAFNQTGEGPWSEVLLIATRPTPPLTAPSGVQIHNVSPYSFEVVWVAAEDALSYEVAVARDPRFEKNVLVRSTPDTTLTVAEQKPESTYFIRVRKVNRGGGGPWSQARELTTPAVKRTSKDPDSASR